MKKRWLYLSMIISVAMGVIFPKIFKFIWEVPSSSEKKEKGRFIDLPITSWTSAEIPCPCLPVQIEETTADLSLDLGFRGFFSISDKLISQIREKTLLGSLKRYDIRGNEYEKNIFEIPQVRIGNSICRKAPIQEDIREFYTKCCLIKEHSEYAERLGRIGWELFKGTNLVLDLGRNRIALCDSISTLELNGYDIKAFSKTPLTTDRGFIELDIDIPNRSLRCVLDTGCTWNFMNCEPETGKSLDEMAWDPRNQQEFSAFKIAEKEFDSIVFHKIPIDLPIHVDAFLGMEFFMKHIVFISFKDGFVYVK